MDTETDRYQGWKWGNDPRQRSFVGVREGRGVWARGLSKGESVNEYQESEKEDRRPDKGS